MSSIEVKIRKLDGELARYKEQMAKLRNGPGKVSARSFTSLNPRANFALSVTFPLFNFRSLSFVLCPFPQDAIQQRAMRTLKQKRMYEAQIAQLTQQTFNMESAALATDNLRNTMATVDAMQIANKEMRKQYGKIDIDKIEVRIAIGLLFSFYRLNLNFFFYDGGA